MIKTPKPQTPREERTYLGLEQHPPMVKPLADKEGRDAASWFGGWVLVVVVHFCFVHSGMHTHTRLSSWTASHGHGQLTPTAYHYLQN
jgi:hypothetical protein